ncbi:MAG: tRNA pseudouridine(38-40) synthase TruA, partial [Bacteroidota bacterium]
MPPNLRRYFLQIAYRGTHYHGWQVQQNAITVQGVIQAGLAQVLRSKVPIVGSSRTDTGVHAQQQFAHVDLATNLNIDQLNYQLNAVLPPDIAIEAIRPVMPEAHARFDAIARTYLYTIVRAKSPFQRETSHWLRGDLDVTQMNEAAAILCQKQDFQSLCKARPVDHHFLCNVMEACWLVQKGQLIFCIKANRFLRSMVRLIVSLLLRVGQETLSLSDFEAFIDKKQRDLSMSLVPARGLALTEVVYPEH